MKIRFKLIGKQVCQGRGPIMKDNAPVIQGKMDTGEELLNFDLEDLASENIDENPLEEDEEAIDLVELVEKGDEEVIRGAKLKGSPERRPSDTEPDLELKTHEIEEIQQLDSDEAAPKEQDVLDFSDITLEMSDAEVKEMEAREVSGGDEITEADFDSLLAEETEETVRLELKGEEKSEASKTDEEEEIPESDFEDLLEEELEGGVELEEGAEPETQRLSLERQGIVTPASGEVEIQVPLGIDSKEEPKRTFTRLEEGPEIIGKESATEDLAASSQEIGGIREEQLEAVITRVVEDVLERVARETMTNVAEKLITEAIEALKKSIESSSDG
jgi:hypothetical protein